MSSIKPIGCYSKLASVKKTIEIRITSTANYSESLLAVERHNRAKNQVMSKLNPNTRQWIINK